MTYIYIYVARRLRVNITGDLSINPAQISIPMNVQWDTRIKLEEPGLS